MKGTRQELESRNDINIVLMYVILKKINKFKNEFAFQNPFLKGAERKSCFALI